MNEVVAPAQGLKGVPWSNEEHAGFLLGLEKLGKGNWRGISRTFVPTRTPTQVASHAQKYFLRAANGGSKRKSRFCGVTSTYAASQPTKVPRTAGSPLDDSSSPANLQHRAAPAQQGPQQVAPHQSQTLLVASSTPSNADAASHLRSPEATRKALPSAAAAAPNSLPFPPNPACPTLGVPLPVHLASPPQQAQHERGGGTAIRPTVYGVPCFPMLPGSSMMGCVLPSLLPLNTHHAQPTQPQPHMPEPMHVPPACVSALLSQQQQLHEQQQRQQQQQCAAEMSFGPLNTLALASADVAGKEGEGAAGKPVPRAAPIKQEEGSASPAASNASNNSSCSNHSTHDSILTAALRAGLCRPEPVRGCSAQASSLLASLQPSASASFYSCASSGALAAMDLVDNSAQQQQQQLPPQQRFQQVHALGAGRPSAFRPIGKKSLAC